MNPLSRRDVTRIGAAAFVATVMRVRAQTAPPAAAAPQFEVAVIRPANPQPGDSSGIQTGHGRIHGENVTLKRCIIGAYAVGPNQVVGGPDWIDTDRFDIQAKADQDIDDDDVLNRMLQGLLADRFKLALHRATQTASAYVLEVDKRGSKMERAEGGESVTNMSTGSGGRTRLDVKNTGMDLFAQVLARKMDLPVVNETGLTGVFNFKLAWLPDNLPPPQLNGAPDPNAPPGIFTALQEQLGLRLRSAKAPVAVLVIDHAEKPSGN